MNLRVIQANLVVSVKSFYREKPAVFFRLAFPVILVLVFGTIFMERDNRVFDLDVQDLDQTESSAQIVEAIAGNKGFRVTELDPTVDPSEYARVNGRDLVLVIPKGYEAALLQREMGGDPAAFVTLTEVQDPSSFGVTTKTWALHMAIAAINQNMTGKPAFIRSTETSILSKKYRFIEFFVPGVIAMAVMTASLFGAVNVNAELRQKGVIRKLSTTPITRTEWILANVLYQVVLAIITTTVILLVSYLVFHVSLAINIWLPVFVVLAVFAFVGVGMILTRVAREAESAAAAANAVMFPLMFLSGTFFPVAMMPEFLQQVAHVLPLYYVNEGLRAAMVAGDNWAALRCALIVAVFAAITFAIGVATTRLNDEST